MQAVSMEQEHHVIENKDSVIADATAIKADGMHMAAHGPSGEIARASAILATQGAAPVDLHLGAAGAVQA